MSISGEIKDFAIEANQNLLWQKQEEEATVKKETIVDNKYKVRTLIKMGERKDSRRELPKEWTLKWFYDACYYEIVIDTIGGYRLDKYTKRFRDFMDAGCYHYDLANQFREVK